MACFVRIAIEVKDRAAALDAMRRLGIRESQLIERGGKLFVSGIDPAKEAAFRTEYAKSYSIAEAKKKLYRLSSERKIGDKIVLTFDR